MAPFWHPESTKIHPKIGSKRHHKNDRFLDRFLGHLGSILGAKLGPCWRLFRPKFAQRHPKTRPRILQPSQDHPRHPKMRPRPPKSPPRCPQDLPNMRPRTLQNPPRPPMTSQNAPKTLPKTLPGYAQDLSENPPEILRNWRGGTKAKPSQSAAQPGTAC